MFDMIIISSGDDLLLDIERARKDDLIRRLTMYKLRADVTIEDASETLSLWAIDSAPTSLSIENAVAVYKDPRSEQLGSRAVMNAEPDFVPWPYAEYETLRLQNTVPDGSRDMKVEKYFWLETNAEAINGVDFDKGCYVGQELTARMKHRTNIKKCLVSVISKDGNVTSDTPITNADGKTIGDIHSVSGNIGIAFVRLEYIKDNAPLFADGTSIIVQPSA